jgi:hypothetical protein
MKNITCTLITKVALGGRVKEYNKIQKTGQGSAEQQHHQELAQPPVEQRLCWLGSRDGQQGVHVAPDLPPTNERQMSLPFNRQDRGECNGKGCLERTPNKIVYLNGAAQRNPMSQKGSEYLDR